jgi:tRNA dimethylallyltransferase
MKTLIVILGPTGVGKTELCLQVAQHLRVPIINADSRQIFAELPIGTAAPTAAQQQRVRHYFVGTHHLTDYYSASMYEQDVLRLLDDLFSGRGEDGVAHDVALMTGGSMMYIDAVCNGIDDIPTVDDRTREEMKRRLAQEGLPALVDELRRLDPEHWQVVDRQNPRRVVHALEICHMTGKTYTSFRTNSRKQRPFRIVKVGLNRSREELYGRINARVLEMLAQGLEEEARRVYPLRGLNSLNTVGYKEMFAWFDGSIDRDEAVRQIQSNSRRYMRKQLTWFKKDDSIRWFSPDNIEDILNYIDIQRR